MDYCEYCFQIFYVILSKCEARIANNSNMKELKTRLMNVKYSLIILHHEAAQDLKDEKKPNKRLC